MASHESQMYVAPNPETHFEELFRVVQPDANNSNIRNQQCTNVPMRQRNFPDSFFRQPSCSSSTSHSRESSLDATFNSNFVNKNNSNSSNLAKPPATPIQANSTQRNGRHVSPSPPFVHQKAHSLPASLPNQKFVVASITNLDNNNNKSPMISGQNAIISQRQPLPPPPLQQFRQKQLTLPNHNATNNNNFHCRQQSFDIDKISLPDGWTMSFDSDGQRYFIDHKHKITTWDDPRIKITQQNFANLTHTSNPIIDHPVAYQSQQQQQIQPPFIVPNNNNNNNYDPIHFTTLPDTGFLFNSNMTTMPTEIASVTEKMKGQILTDDTNQTTNQQQQQIFDPQYQYLTELRMEREKMRSRAEILKSNPMVSSDYIPSLQMKTSSSNKDLSNIEPSTTTTMMIHGRQESQDSGLGGSATGTLNSINFQNEANLFNDFSSNGHVAETSGQLDSNVVQCLMSESVDLLSITDLDLEGLDIEQYIQHNPINNDLGQLFNHDETMTWNV